MSGGRGTVSGSCCQICTGGYPVRSRQTLELVRSGKSSHQADTTSLTRHLFLTCTGRVAWGECRKGGILILCSDNLTLYS